MIGGKTISGFVITYNEEANIRDCLESMKWADEIVVVDSFSEDGTVEIARQYTDRIIQRPFAGYVEQMRFAFEQTSGDWALWLDADERLTPEALDEMRERFERPGGPGCEGFTFPRRTHFLGRWVRRGGWYPQRKLRLFRRDAARIEGDGLTPRAVVEGRVRKMRGDILHYSYPGGMVDYVERMVRYADIWARAQHAAAERPSVFGIVTKPPMVFLKSYVLQLGVLEGVVGLTVATGTAYYKFLRQMRLWELWHCPPAEPAGRA